MISTLPNSGPDPEKVRLAQQVRRWKNTCMNMMDRYSDLCEAAGVTGHGFFTDDMDDVHELMVSRLRELARGKATLGLPLKISKKDLRKGV